MPPRCGLVGDTCELLRPAALRSGEVAEEALPLIASAAYRANPDRPLEGGGVALDAGRAPCGCCEPGDAPATSWDGGVGVWTPAARCLRLLTMVC